MSAQPYQQELTDLRQGNAQLVQALQDATQRNLALTAEVEQLRQAEKAQHQREASLQKQLQALLDLYNQAPCGYHSLNHAGFFIHVNDTELAWLGYCRENLLHKKRFIDLISQASLDLFESSFILLKEQGWIKDIEIEMVCADDTLLPVLLSSTVIYDAAGHYVMSRSTIFDIRERRRTEEQLKQANEALEEIVEARTLELQKMVNKLQYEQEFTHVVVESVSDGVVACDAQGRLRLFNRAAREWHGCDPREVPPELWASLYDLYEADGVTPLQTERIPLLRAFSGESVRQVGMAIAIRGQEPRYLLASGDPLIDATGQKIGAVVAMHDVTERKRTEEALRKSEAQLRQQALELEQTLQNLQHTQFQLIQSEKMSSLGQLVAGVAHEINNPVNFIYGNLLHAHTYAQDLLSLMRLYQQEYPKPTSEIELKAEEIDLEFLMEDLPKLLASMKVGADRIQQIVASLRVFSHIDEAECKAVDIHDGINSTLMILQNRLKARSDRPAIKVIQNYGNLPLVECYAGQLNQVFMNIISNAIDSLEDALKSGYSAHWSEHPLGHQVGHQVGPTITLSTEQTDAGYALIRIADNGLGMTSEVQKRLFDPFFTTKAVGKGTGMGLSISYQIIAERHQGTLGCTSVLEQGAEFRIQIPIRQKLPAMSLPESVSESVSESVPTSVEAVG